MDATKKACQGVGAVVMAASAVCAAPVSAAASGVTYEVWGDSDRVFNVKYTKSLPGPNFRPSPEALDKLSGQEEDLTGSWSKTVPLGSADFVFLVAFRSPGQSFGGGWGDTVHCRITFNGKVVDEEDGLMAECMGPKAQAQMDKDGLGGAR